MGCIGVGAGNQQPLGLRRRRQLASKRAAQAAAHPSLHSASPTPPACKPTVPLLPCPPQCARCRARRAATCWCCPSTRRCRPRCRWGASVKRVEGGCRRQGNSKAADGVVNGQAVAGEPLLLPGTATCAARPARAQARVFAPTPPGVRRCIVATNIAETSVTGAGAGEEVWRAGGG